MFGGNEADKLKKLGEKKNSGKIIKELSKKNVDKETLIAGIEALGMVQDEDANNYLTGLMESAEDPDVRIAAAKACISVGTEYMKTRLQSMLASEKDQKVLDAIREDYDKKFL